MSFFSGSAIISDATCIIWFDESGNLKPFKIFLTVFPEMVAVALKRPLLRIYEFAFSLDNGVNPFSVHQATYKG